MRPPGAAVPRMLYQRMVANKPRSAAALCRHAGQRQSSLAPPGGIGTRKSSAMHQQAPTVLPHSNMAAQRAHDRRRGFPAGEADSLIGSCHAGGMRACGIPGSCQYGTTAHAHSKDIPMIDLYYWTTPNGHKITIFLEETGLPYKIFPINIGKGEQFAKDFLTISPNNRIPAMVDHEPPGGGKPLPMFESGAMLLYLADKTKKFIPQDVRGRSATIEWLFWQMATLGPNSGQNNHFSNYAVDKIPYAMDRYRNEVNRLYGVLERRLAEHEYMAGDYSIAPTAGYPLGVIPQRQHQKNAHLPKNKPRLDGPKNRPAADGALFKGKEKKPKP